jgi:Nucleotidyl transferase AbiEii toxin, Type IV TA system
VSRPRSAKEFQRLLQGHAATIGQPPQRVLHLVRVAVVCAMVDHVRHADGGHLFVVKGGTAMQLRLGIQARATTDLDVVFRGRLEDWLNRFDEATAGVEWNGFTLTRKKPPQVIEVPGVGYQPWRVPLQLRYEGNEFGTVSLEVAIDEQTASHHELVTPTILPLCDFEIEGPAQIPCLDIPYQIAQKLHACTEPIEGGNPRVRDVIDIWLLERLLDPADIGDVRAAVVETFRRRQKHAWPPASISNETWQRDYDIIVSGLLDDAPPFDDPTSYVTNLVHRIVAT